MKVPQYLRWLFDQPQKDNSEIIEEPANSAKRWVYEVAVLLVLASLFFFFGAGEIALLGPDEPRYAEVAREMFVSGDYISTRLCGCLWFEKPVLFYWLAAASYHLFGVSEFAARFASGFAATLTTLAVYFAVSRAVSTQLARLASLALLSSGIFIAYSHAATPDMSLTMAMTIAILAGFLATKSKGRRELGFMVLCFASMGLSLLAKGLVGIVLVSAILLIYFAIAGRLRFLRWRNLLIWMLAFVVVAATWYLPVTLKHGWQFINEFFIEHHFRRYLTNTYGHPQPIYFFLFVAVAGVLPWTFFLIPAVVRLRSLKPRTSEIDSLLTLAWIWLFIPLIFFSISESKLPGYLLPVFPALAIILGAELRRLLSAGPGRLLTMSAWLTGILMAGLAVGFIWYLNSEGVQFAGAQTALFVLPVLFAALSVWALAKLKLRQAIACITAVVVSLVVGGVSLLFPNMNDEISLKRLSLETASALRPGEKIGFYILKEFAPVFYAQGRVVCDIGEGDVLNALKEDKLVPPLEIYPTIIFITRERWLEGLKKDQRFTVEFIAQQGEYYAFRVKLK
jgi:4-amino-4-deoxy-L-arabinose transferase-like glycosyltransferase